MNLDSLRKAIASICAEMEVNKNYLIELDQQNGDGDLGLNMVAGFRAVDAYLNDSQEKDLGKLMMKCGGTFNEAAPSSLGTILSLCFMGMAKSLKGKEEATFAEFTDAYGKGLENVMKRAESKPGEKTILDALYPAYEVMQSYEGNPKKTLLEAADAAEAGSEATRQMLAVHGRAARYGVKSIGILDGGSVAGKLIVRGIAKAQG